MSGEPRPSADVIVPFLGSLPALAALVDRLATLRLGPRDTLLVVDNGGVSGRAGAEMELGGVPVLSAPGVRTPGYARNRGAAHGSGVWLVFFDADTIATADLLERLFDPLPADRTGILGGGVRDEEVPRRGNPVARYSYVRQAMGQDDTFRFGRWGYPKSANMAVRRAAFESVGGFRERMRAGEDADLTYRLRAAGWEVGRREAAYVVHVGRRSVRSFVHQKLVHGSGGAWLEREHPGSFPARRRPGLLWWGTRRLVTGMLQALLRRDADLALRAWLEPVELIAFELGRSLPNERPITWRVWALALRRLVPPRGTPRL